MPKEICILNCYDHIGSLFNFNGKLVGEKELLVLRVASFSDVSISSFDVFSNEFPDKDFDAYILSGSYFNPDRDSIAKYSWMGRLLSFIRETHEKKIPLLGICFGHQMISIAFGAKVFKLPEPEIGFRKISISPPGKKSAIFDSIPDDFFGVFFHFWAVYKTSLPFGSKLLAESPQIPDQATAFSIDDCIFAVQFHPERVSADVKVMFESRKNMFEKNMRFNYSESSDANLKVLENFVKLV